MKSVDLWFRCERLKERHIEKSWKYETRTRWWREFLKQNMLFVQLNRTFVLTKIIFSSHLGIIHVNCLLCYERLKAFCSSLGLSLPHTTIRHRLNQWNKRRSLPWGRYLQKSPMTPLLTLMLSSFPSVDCLSVSSTDDWTFDVFTCCHKYSLISSSLTAEGVRTPRSVNRRVI